MGTYKVYTELGDSVMTRIVKIYRKIRVRSPVTRRSCFSIASGETEIKRTRIAGRSAASMVLSKTGGTEKKKKMDRG